jgi:hypothetical protein
MTEEMKEIRLEVGRVSGRAGEDNDLKVIKFTGRELASFRSYHGEVSSGDDRGMTHTLYQTEKGKFLIYTEEWSRWDGEADYKSYEVYDTLDEVKEPEGLIREAKEALGLDPAEDLNI